MKSTNWIKKWRCFQSQVCKETQIYEGKYLAAIQPKSYQGAAFQEEVIDHEMAWTAAKSAVSYKAQHSAQKAKNDVNPTAVNRSIWFKKSPFCKI
jgi:hypothetical protein